MKSPFGRAAIAATTMLVLAACAGDRPVAPDVGAPAFSVEAANLPLTLSCAWNTVDQTAKALFNSNQDAVFGILSNMRTAHRNGNMTLATSLGFDALREAAIARGGPRIKNSAGGTQADNFTKAVFGCTVHNVIPGDMSVASAWATGGVYAIRGGGDVGAVKSTGTNPKFGAEAPDEWPATRFLIWGFKTTNPFTGEAVTDAFRLETHPTTSFASNPIRVGLCLDPLTNTGAARRLIHGKSTGPTVGALSLVQFCSDPGDFAALTQSSGFFAAARRALALFAPQEALAFNARGGVGSLETSLSPFGSFTLDPATTEVTWHQPPVSGTKAGSVQSPAIAINFLTNGGAPIADVEWVASIYNNNGQPSQQGTTGLTATTDANGRATFSNFSIPSPGGYTMEIRSAVTTEFLVSLRFNISP